MDDATYPDGDDIWNLLFQLMTNLPSNVAYCELLRKARNQDLNLALLASFDAPSSSWERMTHDETKRHLAAIARETFRRVDDAIRSTPLEEESWSEQLIDDLLVTPHLIARLHLIASSMRAKTEPQEIDEPTLRDYLANPAKIDVPKRLCAAAWVAGPVTYSPAAYTRWPLSKRAVVLENEENGDAIQGEMEAWREADPERSWKFRLVFPETLDQPQARLSAFAGRNVRIEFSGVDVDNPYTETGFRLSPKIGLISNPLALRVSFDDPNLRIVLSVAKESSRAAARTSSADCDGAFRSRTRPVSSG